MANKSVYERRVARETLRSFGWHFFCASRSPFVWIGDVHSINQWVDSFFDRTDERIISGYKGIISKKKKVVRCQRGSAWARFHAQCANHKNLSTALLVFFFAFCFLLVVSKWAIPSNDRRHEKNLHNTEGNKTRRSSETIECNLYVCRLLSRHSYRLFYSKKNFSIDLSQ